MRTRAIPLLMLLALCPNAGHALDFTPPICAAPLDFSDVPGDDPACPWIQQLARDGVALGCGGGKFCPQQPVTRAAMAAFLERAMRGTSSWSPAAGYYARTLVVNPVPGDPQGSGAALLAAVADLFSASATNRYLVKLEPGIYDLSGTAGLDVHAYVDLEGSGVGVTTIVAQTLLDSNLVYLEGESEVRFLTIRGEMSPANPSSLSMVGPGVRRLSYVGVESLHGTAVSCWPGGVLHIAHATMETQAFPALRLEDCQATVEDSAVAVERDTGGPIAIRIASGALLEMRRSEVFAGAYNGFNVALDASDATLRLDSVHLHADGGPYSSSLVEAVRLVRSNTTIVGSDLEATGSSVDRWTLRASSDAGNYVTNVRDSRFSHGSIQATAHDVIHIANSQLDEADADTNGGTISCFKSYDENFHNFAGNPAGLIVCP